MVIGDLRFHRAGSLGEACELGEALGEGTYFLAGGTELIPDAHRGRDELRHLVSLRDVTELHGIEAGEGGLRLRALVTIEELCTSPDVRRSLPALAEASATLASPPIRNLATIGGNFARAVPCADTPPVCIAADATVVISGGSGSRSLPAEKFFVGPRRTAMNRGELLVEIVVPAQSEKTGLSYQRFAHRRGAALAVAAVAARLTLDGDRIESARIVLGAVGPTFILATRAADALAGHAPGRELFAEAGNRAAEESLPISDVRGSVEFRRELVRVLTRRALEQAAVRAGRPNGSVG
jgi:carbon-monoxide dehydrogenase medium subunit